MAEAELAASRPLQALHYLDIAQASTPVAPSILKANIKAYELLLNNAVNVTKNNCEKDYMRTLIAKTKQRLSEME